MKRRNGVGGTVAAAARAICATLLLGVLVVGFAPAAGAQSSERIVEFQSDITLNTDGSVDVVEVITYDFGSRNAHGIFRYVPLVFEWNGDAPGEESRSPGDPEPVEKYERVTPISNIRVDTSDGTPGGVEESDEDGNKVLKIGDPDRTISGEHTYVISYRLSGVTNAFEEYDELYLNVTGNGWEVPIDSTKVTVDLPSDSTKSTCFFGPTYSSQVCEGLVAEGKTVTVTQSQMEAYNGLTIVIAQQKGVLADPLDTMVLREVWSVPSAFRITPATALGGSGVLLGGIGLVSLLGWSKGRDRQYAGGATDVAFGNYSGEEARVPLFNDGATTVEFVPPEGIRPGHMGTLWDEEAHHIDVTAMIVDLAVRGYIRIDEMEPTGTFRKNTDYRLVKLIEVAPDSSELLAAEMTLYTSLFRDGDSPALSELKTNFASRLAIVQEALYNDSVDLGWFPTRPDKVRSKWQGIGVLLAIVGLGVAAVVALTTHAGLVAAPLPIIGLGIVAFSGRFPHRTARGTALLTRVKGFKEIFDAGEGERQGWAESKHIFAQYLPYAIVFGDAEKWAKTFEDLGLSPEEMGYGRWYTAQHGYYPYMMARAMTDFTTTSIGSMAAAAPSTSGGASFGGSGFSGGFSGGGFGGGGGGSW